MKVMVFGVAGRTIALKLEGIEKILSPGETPPAGRVSVDFATCLGQEGMTGEEPSCHVLLAGGGPALGLGRPLGTARVEPAWIVPLPGYIFAGGRTPYRGLIDVAGRKMDDASRRLLHHTLLLDEEWIGRTDWNSEARSC